jgi:aspartate carbamoyltransferase catalytic subunit
MPDEVTGYLRGMGMLGVACHSPEEVISSTDILYATRIQKERFPDLVEYEKVAGLYRVDPDLLSRGPAGLIVMHPLPRVNEITPEVDAMPQAKYFVQAFNAVPVRMALLSMVIGGQ